MRAAKVGEQRTEVEERHEGRRPPADVGDRFRLRRMKREQERRDEGGVLVFEKISSNQEQQRRVHRVQRDVQPMKTKPESPVQRIARFQKRPYAKAGALEQRGPGV